MAPYASDVVVMDATNSAGGGSQPRVKPSKSLDFAGPAKPEPEDVKPDKKPVAKDVKSNEVDLDNSGTKVSFEIDNERKEVVVRLLDKESGEVIREVPPEKLRDVAEMLKKVCGNLRDCTA